MSRRIEGVDVARGLASLIMIQGHAYDGWVSPEGKATSAYAFTRLLGTLPLPAFLVLAGAALALRADVGRRRGEDPASVRRGLVRRGLEVMAWGYGTNLVYGLMDGFDGVDTLLRADVLQVIGLSLVLLGATGVRRGARSLDVAAAAFLLLPTLLAPWLSPLGAAAPTALRPVVGLFVDVPGITRMPAVPLIAWMALGVLGARAMLRARRDRPLPAGAPDRWFVGLAVLAVVVAVAGQRLTVWAVGDGTLSRAHPAVWFNVIDLGARGLVVLAAGGLLAPRLPSLVRRGLLHLGRASLYAYVFHIPFCYGRLGEPLRGRLDMLSATAAVVGLMAASYAVVRLRQSLPRLVALRRQTG
jgi:acyltransferase